MLMEVSQLRMAATTAMVALLWQLGNTGHHLPAQVVASRLAPLGDAIILHHIMSQGEDEE